MWGLPEGISGAAIVILLLMTFGLSRNSMLGLPEELIHRPFVWVYWLVGTVTAGRLFSLTAAGRGAPHVWLVAAGLLCLCLVPIFYGRHLQHGKWATAKPHYGIKVDRGLVASAAFIRKQPPSDAIVQDSDLDEPFPILDGLSERGSFAGRPKFWRRISRSFRDADYREQLEKLHALQSARSLAALRKAVRETGIRWYVIRPGDSYPWPDEFAAHPALQSGGYKVYDMKECFKLRQ